MDLMLKKEMKKFECDYKINYSAETKPLNLSTLNFQMLTLRKLGRNHGKRVR